MKKLLLLLMLIPTFCCGYSQCVLKFGNEIKYQGTETQCNNERTRIINEYRSAQEKELASANNNHHINDEEFRALGATISDEEDRELGIKLGNAILPQLMQDFINQFSIECSSTPSQPVNSNNSNIKKRNEEARQRRNQELERQRNEIQRRNQERARQRYEEERRREEERIKKAKEDAARDVAPLEQKSAEMINYLGRGGQGEQMATERINQTMQEHYVPNEVVGTSVKKEKPKVERHKNSPCEINITDAEVYAVTKNYMIYVLQRTIEPDIKTYLENVFYEQWMRDYDMDFVRLKIQTGDRKNDNMKKCIIKAYNSFCSRVVKMTDSVYYDILKDYKLDFNDETKVYDLASLSDDVYKYNNFAPIGWKIEKSYPGKNGFYARLYKSIYNKDVYVLAFRGSEGDVWESLTNKEAFYDWVITNLFQGLGIEIKDSQHEQAVKCIDGINVNGKLYITGHSLGGGLASIAALRRPECETYTFNAAGVLGKTRSNFVANIKETNAKNIIAYSTCADPLTKYQEANNMKINLSYVIKILSDIIQDVYVCDGTSLKLMVNPSSSIRILGFISVIPASIYKNDPVIKIRNATLSMLNDVVSVNDTIRWKKIKNEKGKQDILKRIDYDFLPPALGNGVRVRNSKNMGHAIAPIVDEYDKFRYGNGKISDKRRQVYYEIRKMKSQINNCFIVIK